MLPKLLARYYSTRYRLNRLSRIFAVKPHERVLDIGSGGSPFAPADMICEKFPWDDRERPSRFVGDRPLVVGDLEALPFKDKSFDFIHLSHVLEHVFDPAKAIEELMRVGKRGYIEVPTAYYEKSLRSWGGHLWFISLEGNTLVFRPKPRGILDEEQIQRFESELLDKDPHFTAYYYARLFPLFHIGYWWEGKVSYRVEGKATASESFGKGVVEYGHGEQKAEEAKGLAHIIKSWVRRRAVSAKRTELSELIACPICHQALFQAPMSWACATCGKSFPNQQGIPVLLSEAAIPQSPASPVLR